MFQLCGDAFMWSKVTDVRGIYARVRGGGWCGGVGGGGGLGGLGQQNGSLAT